MTIVEVSLLTGFYPNHDDLKQVTLSRMGARATSHTQRSHGADSNPSPVTHGHFWLPPCLASAKSCPECASVPPTLGLVGQDLEC